MSLGLLAAGAVCFLLLVPIPATGGLVYYEFQASSISYSIVTYAFVQKRVVRIRARCDSRSGDHEIQGLRYWDGDPTVRLLEFDESLNAMLLERCEPGTRLRTIAEPEQDAAIGVRRRVDRQ